MDIRHQHGFLRRIGSIAGILLTCCGCIVSLPVLYGGGSWASAARLEASHLVSLELTELVGTTDYTQAKPVRERNLLTAISEALKLPLVNPVGMLEANLPLPSDAQVVTSDGQSSLFQSLTDWEQSTNKLAIGWVPYDTPSRTIKMMEQSPGITVVSPKTMSVAATDGSLKDRTDPSVVKFAHDHHIKVWALIDNQFSGKLTHTVLADSGNRTRLVQAIAAAVKRDHLDGINVDFENIQSKDQAVFTQFIHELANALHSLGAAVSVDITPDIVFLHDEDAFFHAGLAEYCDYVVVMAYDEHWGGDQTPGPVADVPWVTNAVDDLLATGVPARQLILGLPFYTELWHVHTDGSVTSQAVATSSIPDILSEHHADTQWLNDLGVAYARYPLSEGYMEVWYETAETLNRKLGLVNDRGLAGVAIWSLSLSDGPTWSKMLKTLRQAVS